MIESNQALNTQILPYTIPEELKDVMSMATLERNLKLLDFLPKSLPSADHFQIYALTGGPSVGKSTLLKTYETFIKIIPEAATLVQNDLIKNGVEQPRLLPDLGDRIIAKQAQLRSDYPYDDGVTICDRTEIDTLTYEIMFSHNPSQKVIEAARKVLHDQVYHHDVILLENLGFVVTNQVRIETSMEIVKYIENNLKTVYSRLGFNVILIPNRSVEERQTMLSKVLKV